MPATNYPNGFLGGVTIRGVPILQTHPGKVFWVSNVTTGLMPGQRGGSNSNKGDFNSPVSTLDYALDQCVAGRGDIIVAKPGHAETITTAAILVMDKAGVAIVGLGAGASRPTLTFGTNATANIPITAANMSISNFLFVSNKADVASVFTATGANTPTDFVVENCEFRDTSSILNFLAIITGNATSNSMSGLGFNRNRISSLGTTAATTAIKILQACARVEIMDNFGVWAILNDTAAMLDASTFSITSFRFGGNVLFRPNTSSTGGSFIAGSGTDWTGVCHDNRLWQLDATAGIWIPTGTKLGFLENYSPITGAADKSGLINPVAV